MRKNKSDLNFITRTGEKLKSIPDKLRGDFKSFRSKSPSEKMATISEFILSNAMYIIIITAITVIAIVEPRFISAASIVNIISLTAAKLPIALGIGGAIVLSGTDISAEPIIM